MLVLARSLDPHLTRQPLVVPLVRGSWGTGDGIQVDFLMVMVANDAGQALHMGHYDPEDEERSLEDVRRRFVAASDAR